MNSQTKLNNSFAIRSFLALVGGVVLAQLGAGIGRSSSNAVNWYFIATCLIYAIVPVAVLLSICRSSAFPRKTYTLILNVAALLAIATGLAYGLKLF